MDVDQPAVERLPLCEEEWLTQVWNGTAADGYPVRLAEILPTGFPCYVRIFHPFLPPGADDVSGAAPRTTWQELALAAGVPFSRHLVSEELDSVLPMRDGRYVLELWEGELPPAIRTALFSHLASRSPEPVFLYFGLGTLWEGPLLYRAACQAVETVKRVAAADIDHPRLKGQEAVWPPDRSWFVSTDFDCVSTYLGCDEELAALVMNDPDIEALVADLDDRIE